MNFVQKEFLLFMAVVFAVYWGLPAQVTIAGRTLSKTKLQNLFLFGASSFFYSFVHPWFLGLLYYASILDYFAGLAMARWPERRQLIVALSICNNLGLLAYFKYFDFFIENVAAALQALGVNAELHTLGILLPLGISFYTFQTMSYTIDIYRGELKPRTDLLDYMVYVMLFPQLVAGPIMRAVDLLPQVERSRTFSWDQTRSGFGLAMWGAFKKVVIADTIAPYVDKVFVHVDPSGPLIWAGAFGFMIQIFADFSGYTDIARGTGRLLGFHLSENFKSPYLAASTPEFWQRWHISLSFWIRDYLMVPLLGSGSRLTLFRFIWATIATFTIIGFWHGAQWNFILFGFFHGVWMTIYTLINRVLPDSVRNLPFGRPVAIVFHWFAVSLPGSLLFRETHLERLTEHFSKNPFSGSDDHWMAAVAVFGVTVTFALPMIAAHYIEKHLVPRLEGGKWWLPIQTGTWAVLAVVMFVFWRTSAYDFVYFQF